MSASWELGNSGLYLGDLRGPCVVNTSFNSLQYLEACARTMKNTNFVVKLNRAGTHATECVQRIDLTPSKPHPTVNWPLAIGRFTTEDAVKSIQNSRFSPELVFVRVSG